MTGMAGLNRLGKLKITGWLMRQHAVSPQPGTTAMLGAVAPIDVDYSPADDTYTVTAVSHLFDEMSEAEAVPAYHALVTVDGDGNAVVSMERQYD